MTPESMATPMLDLVQFDLTDECPLFCRHCSNSSGPQLRSALTYDAVGQAIADAAGLGCRAFTFSGGEPLRYPDLIRLLTLCRELAVSSTLFTTGVRDTRTRLPMSESEWAELRALGLGTAIFSAYSGPTNRAFHNSVVRLRPMGMRDAFEVNELGIRNARDAGISIELQFVPSNETCSELPSVTAWATELGVSQLHLQYPTSQGRNTTNPSLDVDESHESLLKEYVVALPCESAMAFHVSRLWRSRWGIPAEISPREQIIVRSDGVVVRCNACKYILEPVSPKNIYQQSLWQLWNDESWRNAPCECSTQRVSQAAASGRSGVYVVQADGLFASGTK
jgi:MoaA/NifB/PqqE/SkfB family radical SAM enzyme